MKKAVLVSALLLSFGSAQAAESPRWDRVSASYQSVDVGSETLTGFGVSGSKLIGDDFFVTASYAKASDDVDVMGTNLDLDFNTLSAGLGYRYAIAKNSDVFGVVSYEDIEFKMSAQGVSDKTSDNGYGLTAGIRSMVSDKIELIGAVQYVDIADDSETAFSVSGLYNFTEQFSAGLGYTKSDDVDTISVSATYFF